MGNKRDDNIIARVRDIVRQPLAAAAALFAEARIIELPELGVERSVAQAVVDALRGMIASRPDREGDANILSIKRFAAKVKFGRQLAAAWITVKESKLHGHHIYSVEAIKLEALDRIVEVVSGNTPHASSAPTRSIVAFFSSCVNAVFGKISTHRSLLAAAAALLLFAPLSLFADSFEFKGQTVEFENSETPCASLRQPEGRFVAKTSWVSRKEGAEWAHGERRKRS